MKITAETQQTGAEPTPNPSNALGRRGFLRTAALTAAGASAARLVTPSPAQAATGPEKKAYGRGPFPAEGMAVSSSDGPHRLMKFHRRALGRPEITRIPMAKIDDAWSKVVDKEARYRFVIDMTRA